MPKKTNHDSVIAVCVQEPFEDGSKMDLGAIQGSDLKFLHQGFIADTISHALSVEEADTRLYYIDDAQRKKFMGIVLDYVKEHAEGDVARALKSKFSHHELSKCRWGLRIEKVFDECFKDGYQNVLVIGSRTPTVTPPMMQRALRMLAESDAVFGPTPEGRYYTIGLRGDSKIKLSEFDWKSPSIYSDVVAAFDKAGLAWAELEIWYAVETPDEIELMVRDINQYRFEDDDVTARETEAVMERLLSKLGI